MKVVGKNVLGEALGETEGARRATGVFPIGAPDEGCTARCSPTSRASSPAFVKAFEPSG